MAELAEALVNSGRGDDPRSHAAAADGVVGRLLAIRHREGRNPGAELEAHARHGVLPEGLGHGAPTALGVRAAGRGLLSGTIPVDDTYLGGAEPGTPGSGTRDLWAARCSRASPWKCKTRRGVAADDVAELCSRLAIIDKGTILLEAEPLHAVAAMRGRIWPRVMERTELLEFEGAHSVISTKLLAGRTVVRVHSAMSPGAAFDLAEPDLEDVHFSTLAGHYGGRSEQAVL
ncbi:MAG: hypothetical protein AB1505_01845 [Candidatus Latescibacterota bacterium]